MGKDDARRFVASKVPASDQRDTAGGPCLTADCVGMPLQVDNRRELDVATVDVKIEQYSWRHGSTSPERYPGRTAGTLQLCSGCNQLRQHLLEIRRGTRTQVFSCEAQTETVCTLVGAKHIHRLRRPHFGKLRSVHGLSLYICGHQDALHPNFWLEQNTSSRLTEKNLPNNPYRLVEQGISGALSWLTGPAR
jgi:hypothetical protein